jgi:hypothetical protein
LLAGVADPNRSAAKKAIIKGDFANSRALKLSAWYKLSAVKQKQEDKESEKRSLYLSAPFRVRAGKTIWDIIIRRGQSRRISSKDSRDLQK